jgi:hypothetical protein
MPTVRNRRAGGAKQTTSNTSRRSANAMRGAPPPGGGSAAPAPFLLQRPMPPAFPADLILPPRRGAIITTAAWPAGLIPAPLPLSPPRLPLAPPAGRPGGLPDERTPQRDAPPQRRKAAGPQKAKSARKAARRAAAAAEMARRAKQDKADKPETFATAPMPPEALPREPVLLRPTPPDVCATPAIAPASAPPVSAPDDRTPLPRGQALAVPQPGLLDAVAASLGDAGRFLARFVPGLRRSRALREQMARTEARLRAMEAQLAALEALRARVAA